MLGHHERRGGAVVERAGVAGRHTSAVAKGGLQLREAVQRRAGPRRLVLLQVPAADELHRRDLACAEAAVPGLARAFLRALGEAVHLLAGDSEVVSDQLRGLAHRHEDPAERLARGRGVEQRVGLRELDTAADA